MKTVDEKRVRECVDFSKTQTTNVLFAFQPVTLGPVHGSFCGWILPHVGREVWFTFCLCHDDMKSDGDRGMSERESERD